MPIKVMAAKSEFGREKLVSVEEANTVMIKIMENLEQAKN